MRVFQLGIGSRWPLGIRIFIKPVLKGYKKKACQVIQAKAPNTLQVTL